MGKGKPRKCPICRQQLESGRALGGHMSKHKAAKLKRAATLASKGVQTAPVKEPAVLSPEARERLKEVRDRIASGVPSVPPVTMPRAAQDLRAAAKRKRDEATKIALQAKTKRDEADELDRLAERVEHLL